MEAGKERLTRDAVRDATQQEVQALTRGNVELKQLVAELSASAQHTPGAIVTYLDPSVG